ncbi:MAG: hypothetical protein AAF907_04780 [Planctomycetota bacterium]
MFRCPTCNTVVPPRTKPTFVVTHRRPVEYAERTAEVQGRRGRARTRVIDRGGFGHEIVRQVMTCPLCPGVVQEAPIPEKPVREVFEEEDYGLDENESEDGDD